MGQVKFAINIDMYLPAHPHVLHLSLAACVGQILFECNHTSMIHEATAGNKEEPGSHMITLQMSSSSDHRLAHQTLSTTSFLRVTVLS